MKVAKSVLAIVLSLLMAVAFIGCQKDPNSGIAATVGSTEISEADITALMEYYRIDQETGAAMEDAKWATYVSNATIPAEWSEFFKNKGYTSTTFTPEILREYVIRNNFAVFALMIQKAAEKGFTADQANLDTQMESIRSSAAAEGVTIEDYIRERGFANEKSYRLMLEAYDISQPLAETLVSDPTQDEIDEYIRANVSMYTGKRISLIALAVNEENPEDTVRTKMNEAKTNLDQGTDFATVLKNTVPEDSALIETGGDLGWGYEKSMPPEVTAALGTLEKDQVSNVIEIRSDTAGTPDDPSDDTVVEMYIVKYTDTFTLPGAETNASTDAEGAEGANAAEGEGAKTGAEETSATENLDLSLVPADLKEDLTNMAKQEKITSGQEAFWIELAQSDEIVVNPMPEGLSYAVDMSLATATPTENTPGEETPQPLTPIDSTEAVSAAEATGLQIEDTTVGTGAEVKTGDKVRVYYTGTFTNGEAFDSNAGTGSPLEFTVGESAPMDVIQGWDDGLVGMKVGGKRQLTIPPSLGYGSTDYNRIPANTILKFEIELIAVNGDSTGYVSATGGIDSAENIVE